MFTVEKANKLLDLCKIEYSSLHDEEIVIKEGAEFSAEIHLFDNIVTIVNKLDTENKFIRFMQKYLLQNDIDDNKYMFYNFYEAFSFLHEIGHIYYKDIAHNSNLQYVNFKSKEYTSYKDAFDSYRNIELEKYCDQFAITMLKNQKINIWAIMNNVNIDRAKEESDFWELS